MLVLTNFSDHEGRDPRGQIFPAELLNPFGHCVLYIVHGESKGIKLKEPSQLLSHRVLYVVHFEIRD